MSSRARILLIDDDAGFLRVVSRILSAYPDQLFATSGTDGLRLAREARPDLILLDLEMPELDGLEFCTLLKADRALADIPVIFVTSHRQIPVAVKVFKVGASDFVTKPVDRRKLLNTVETFLLRSPISPADKISLGGWPRIEGIESETIREQIGGDARLFMLLLHKLVGDFADIGEKADAVNPETIETLRTRVHGLKGAAGTLGAGKLFDLAARAESAGLQGDLDAFRRLAAAIAAELDDLRARIARAEAPAAEARAPAGATGQSGGAFDRERLAALLARQSLSALEEFEAMDDQLDAALGETAAADLRHLMRDLRFAEAAQLLDSQIE